MWLKTVSCCLFTLVATVNSVGQQMSQGAGAPGGFQISGTLVDANSGQVIIHARVAIAPVTKRNDLTTVITREDGRFSFSNLMPGKYGLTAQARSYLFQSFNQHDGFSSSIAVGPGLDSSNLVFRLPPEGVISGVVIDEGGEAVRGAQITLYSTGLAGGVAATRSRGGTNTNDEGAYRFGHLPPGRYLVAVSAHPWYAQNQAREDNGGELGIQVDEVVADAQASPQLDVAYPMTFFPSATEPGEATPIVLAAGDNFTADVNVQPVPALHIRLPQNFDMTKHGVGVQRRTVNGTLMPANTNFQRRGNGPWEIVGLPPGSYVLTGVSDSEKVQSEEIDLNSFGQTVKTQGSVTVPVSAKLQVEGSAMAGQIFLQLLNKKSREASSERFGSDGALAFAQGIIPGSYEVSLSSGSGAYLKGVVATGAKVTGRTVEVRAGSEVKLVVTASGGQGSITGIALREDKGFSGAMILLVPADPAHNQVLFRRDQSDSDGTFNLPNVVPGAYTLLAIENGWELEWMKPEVLKNYMARGVAVQVQSNGKYELKVTVQ